MTMSKKFFSKVFFVRIDSECFKAYFKTLISKSKIFLGLTYFLSKMANNCDKTTKSKILADFLVGIDSDFSKRIYERKPRNRKFAPITKPFLRLNYLLAKAD